MATRIMASLVSGSRSWSTSSRLYRTSHPNVRSTTQRLGWIWNPFGALAVVVTRQLHARRTHATKRRLNPESAMTSRTRASSPRTGARSQHHPQRVHGDEPLASLGFFSPRRTPWVRRHGSSSPSGYPHAASGATAALQHPSAPPHAGRRGPGPTPRPRARGGSGCRRSSRAGSRGAAYAKPRRSGGGGTARRGSHACRGRVCRPWHRRTWWTAAAAGDAATARR